MRSQSQIFMVALAIAFAMALALAVALFCLSYLREDLSDMPPQESESDLPVFLPDLLPPEESSSHQTEAPDLPDPGNGLRYVSNGNGTCRLVSVGACADACVVIPEYTSSGDRVTAIDARAFYGCETVTAIQIPASVKTIGELAFADCKNLVYLSVSLQNTEYCDRDGVLYTADERTLILYPPRRAGSTAYIGQATVEICDMAFYNCAYLTEITFSGSASQWERLRIGYKNYSLSAASKTFLAGE